MTVSELSHALNAEILCGEPSALAEPVTGGYCGDLLSWVMGRAPAGGVWVTIMSNANVAAVALLSGVSCVLLAEGVRPDDMLLERLKQEEIPLLCSGDDVFALAGRIYALLHG